MSHENAFARGSIVVRALVRVRDCLESGIAASWVVGTLRSLRPERDVAGDDAEKSEELAGRSVAASVQERSRVLQSLRRIWAGLRGATAVSRSAAGVQWFRRAVEASWLYRWLTAEPDPDVIVIDLRETLTVGPWLALIERAVRWLLPATVSSVLFQLGGRTAAVLRARPVQLLSLFVGSGAAAGLLLTVATGEPSRPAVAVLALVVVFAALGSREDRSWTEVRESRWVELLAAAFEPPEPPAQAANRDETASEEGDENEP
jgi:hypothetical protein